MGSVVHVRLRGRRMRGFVTELLDAPAVADAHRLSGLVGEEPLFSAEVIELARWTARRYLVSVGSVLHEAVPGRYSADRWEGEAAAALGEVSRPAWLRGELPGGGCAVVVPDARAEPELIRYLTSKIDGQALVICPRVDVARAVAGAVEGAALLHGEQRPADRARTWAGARDGRVRVVVGGRAATFVPMRSLALVAVVSAHEESLRAERSPRFHAVHVARRRAERAGVPFVVSSPTPPVDLVGPDGLEVVGTTRSAVHPEIARPFPDPITPRLLDVVRSTVEGGSSVLVFVGRRGDALRLRCADCGWYPRCASCGVGLGTRVVADGGAAMVCRLCGERTSSPDVCAACGGRLDARGWGDERVARALEHAGVGAPVVRITASRSEPIPARAVVVGTLAAAHALTTEVGAVCVADLDQLLGRSDLRAAERALQTLFELASTLRAGGRFLVQTREADHHVVQAFTRRSFDYFLRHELAGRRDAGYPPFGAVVKVGLRAADRDALEAALPPGARVVGGMGEGDRITVLVRGAELDHLLDPLRAFAADHPRTRFDVDPIDV